MVGQFSSKTVPCVGVSVGVERVFAILEREALKQAEELGANIRESKTQVSASFALCRPDSDMQHSSKDVPEAKYP